MNINRLNTDMGIVCLVDVQGLSTGIMFTIISVFVPAAVVRHSTQISNWAGKEE